MAKIVTFGEILLRLAPEGYYRFFQNDRLQATFGGAEANTAIALSNFGMESAFVTRLPAHAIGQAPITQLRALGVDTSHIVRGGSRVGIYYFEKGASQRPSVCIYDRAGSAISEAKRTDFDWDRILADADWFHFTGITPALGGELPEICADACRAAKEKGIPISFDPNYRAKLWSKEQARTTLTALCPYVDILISNVDQILDVFGISPEPSATTEDEIAQSVAAQLFDRFGMRLIAFTGRISHSASDNTIFGTLYDQKGCYRSRQYPIRIVDRVGGGDAFAAGLIYATLSGKSAQDSVDFAVASSALKHTIEGDFSLSTTDEVNALLAGDGSARVQR